jgi:hypothetical protein
MSENELLRPSPIDLEKEFSQFLAWARKDEWAEFDARVLEVCNHPDLIRWTTSGLVDEDLNLRDLALSVLEHTVVEHTEEQTALVTKLLTEDENMHLRRKAAITLFRHNIQTAEVMNRLNEAYQNDPELREQVGNLLGIDG